VKTTFQEVKEETSS